MRGSSATVVVLQGWSTLVLKSLKPACFLALSGLLDGDHLNQVDVEPDVESLESAFQQKDLENRQSWPPLSY